MIFGSWEVQQHFFPSSILPQKMTIGLLDASAQTANKIRLNTITRDLTPMRTGDQRTAFEICNFRNAMIYSCYQGLLLPSFGVSLRLSS